MPPWRNEHGIDWTRVILGGLAALGMAGNAGQFISIGPVKADAAASGAAQDLCCEIANQCVEAGFLRPTP